MAAALASAPSFRNPSETVPAHASTTTRNAQEATPAAVSTRKDWGLSFRVGYLFPGEVRFDGFGLDSSGGMVVAFDVDWALGRYLSAGGFAFVGDTQILGEPVNLVTLGAKLKGRFEVGPVSLRPGVAVGYQSFLPGSALFAEARGLDLAALLEVRVFFNDRFSVASEVSFTSQPAGRDSVGDVTWAPMLFVTAGIGYGL